MISCESCDRNPAEANGLCNSCIEKAPDLTAALLEALAEAEALIDDVETTDERLAQCDEAQRIARRLAAFERNGLVDMQPSAYDQLDTFQRMKPFIVESDLRELVQNTLFDAVLALDTEQRTSYAEALLILDKYAAIDDYREIALKAKANLLGGASPQAPHAEAAPIGGGKLLHLGALLIEVTYNETVNFAMEQNSVPIVKQLRLENKGEAVLENLRLRLSIEPDLTPPDGGWRATVASLAPGAQYHVGDIDIALPVQKLVNVTERERATLVVHAETDHEAHDASLPLELLAYNEWTPAGLPEILAAFVLPNHPSLPVITDLASRRLAEWTKNPALSDYQSKDPKRAFLTAAAIYAALQELGLRYITVPPSFERVGQKIRTPEQILQSKQATCLDIAVLEAACLELCGLHPIVVLIKGHAFAGLWLVDSAFPEPTTDEPSRLRKRVELGEMVFFDSSAVTNQPIVSFEDASRAAMAMLADDDAFSYAVDVHTARKHRIRPLPMRMISETYATVYVPEATPAQVTAQPEFSAPVASLGTPASRTREPGPARLERWKTRLLDLSLRNTLLNYRETKRSIGFQCPDLAKFEDRLADGVTFQLLPRPEIMDGKADPRSAALHTARTSEDAEQALILDGLQHGQLYARATQTDLDRRLLEIWRASRTTMEESGASTLYLAVGFLAWYETPSSEQVRHAPLLLYPVDLVRSSARDHFKLRTRDEEPRVNVTLLQKLQKEYGVDTSALYELPADDHGLDVPLILKRFREAVLPIDRWEIIEELHLGLFSFTKFLMWLDLESRTEALAQNPVVAHLIDGGSKPFAQDGTFLADHAVDEQHASEYFGLLDADSSQLAAVHASTSLNFVLEGPPGAGKSQTITNLIAHNLAQGRTVLFVSEKMAALNVVHRRLEKVGLAPFCLELHSNKARKTEVLGQLRAAIDAPARTEPDEWARRADELQALRRDLNGYVEVLHRKRTLGLSAFQVVSRLVGLREQPRVDLKLPHVLSTTAEHLTALHNVVDELRVAAERVEPVAEHPWRAARVVDWQPAMQAALEDLLRQLGQAVTEVERDSAAAAALLGFSPAPAGLDGLHLMGEAAREVLASPGPASEFLETDGWDERQAEVLRLLDHGRKRNELWQSLSERWRDDLLKLENLPQLRETFQRASTQNKLIAWFTLWSPRRTLRAACKGTLPPDAQILADLETALAVRNEDAWLTAAQDRASRLLRRLWDGPSTSWDEVEHLLSWVEAFRQMLYRIRDFGEEGLSRWRRLAQLASEERARLGDDQPDGRSLRQFLSSFERFVALRDRTREMLRLEGDEAWGRDLGTLRATVQRWLEHRLRLRDWCDYQSRLQHARGVGLATLCVHHEGGYLHASELLAVLDHSFYTEWLHAVMEAEPSLGAFRGYEHARKIEQFRALDAESFRLAREVVKARLSARIPRASGDAAAASEMGILQRELKKKRAQLPPRRLFEAIPNLLARIKPCLLMSPMSVAQYLGRDFPAFDLVVFDEASQIPVWDAIGAIGRARQAIVVGDSRQLPPTSFFSKGDSDESTDEDDVEDLESILDECSAVRLPRHRLKWHYRSRHENLITFSNYHYYDGHLLTFPGCRHQDARLGVHFHAVHGTYDRSRSRTNRAEAEAVVADIVRRLTDPREQRRTIGVVTFSQTQQTLVEDLLEEARRNHPEIERFFTDAVTEPVFVKNLENVQGDERDVVLFSVGYGPDAAGKVSMHFGPLNRDGGERRLNVAITRAREQMVVFSTLRADQIDLTRTNAVGVRHLKKFLEYAARGPAAITEAVTSASSEAFESPFEADVARALTEAGWTVHSQVGCSGYRIDLGLVHPDRPGAYLLGIECDGAAYHSARCARDRDRLRAAVLEGLGWRLHRIWSTDWWYDRDAELRKLDAVVKEAMARAEAPEEADDPPQIEEDAPAEPEVEWQQVASAYEAVAESGEMLLPVGDGLPAGASWYDYHAFEGIHGTVEVFDSPISSAVMSRLIGEVLACEAPISLSEITRRVTAHWGVGRISQRMTRRLQSLYAKWPRDAQPREVGGFLWRPDQDPEHWRGYRVPRPDATASRNAEDIPPQEIANAAEQVLAESLALPVDELARQTARRFGIVRMGSKVRVVMEAGVELLHAQGRCRREGDQMIAGG